MKKSDPLHIVWRSILRRFYKTLQTVQEYIVKNQKRLERYKRLVSHMPIKKNKVFVNNFYGQGYGDNPKGIVDELLQREGRYDIAWLIDGKEYGFPEGVRPVYKHTLRAYYDSATAKIWVLNVRNEKLTKKRKGQVYLHTWHGSTGVKRVEGDAEDKLSKNYIEAAKEDGACVDGMLVESAWLEGLMRRAFWINPECEYLRFGSPKVDEFLSLVNAKTDIKIRERLGFNKNAFIVMYAPTFRDQDNMDWLIRDFSSLKAAFCIDGRDVFIILRLHPNDAKKRKMYLKDLPAYVMDMTDYPDLQELLVITDSLISDYSSVPFVYSLSKKPAFIYVPDLEWYKETRGVNELFLLQPFPVCQSYEELLRAIEDYNEISYQKRVNDFFSQYPMYNDGNASKKIVDWVLEKGLQGSGIIHERR